MTISFTVIRMRTLVIDAAITITVLFIIIIITSAALHTYVRKSFDTKALEGADPNPKPQTQARALQPKAASAANQHQTQYSLSLHLFFLKLAATAS